MTWQISKFSLSFGMPSKYSFFQVGSTAVGVFPMQEVESVTVGVWFKVGGRHENSKENGIAHFIEHMLFKGTKNYNSRELTEMIEGRGGDINAFTAEEMTCYYARMASKHLPLLLDTLFEMTLDSTFPNIEFERERGVIQEEIRMYDDQPSSVVMDVLNSLLWPDHSLGRSITGTVKAIAGMQRKDLIKYWKNNYHPQNMVVAIAGKTTPDEVKHLLHKRLSSKKSISNLPHSSLPRIKSTKRIQMVERPVQQVNLAIGYPCISKHDPRRHALRILSVILGENMSSRLFQSLREKHGLVYSVQSSFSTLSDVGAFYIQAGLERNHLSHALKLIHKEIEKIKTTKINAKELERAKDYSIGQMIMSLESTTNQMVWIGEGMIGYQRIPSSKELIDSLQAVHADEIRSLAQYVFQSERFHAACVGPNLNSKNFDKEFSMFT
jgi:predicted Zn-dependent peptidase